MKSHLKVKVVSLSMEMTYIRKQEQKWKERARMARLKQKEQSVSYAEKNFWSNRWHRIDLKDEVRNSHLAYGAMRGVPYSKMETICYAPLEGYNRYAPKWDKITAMVERFATGEPNVQEIMQRYSEWLADAQKWYEGNPERIEEMKKANEEARQLRLNDVEYQAARASEKAKARQAHLRAVS